MSSPQKPVRGDPIAWLLEPDNLSVHYLTLRHLLRCAKDDPEVDTASPDCRSRSASNDQMDWHDETGRRLE